MTLSLDNTLPLQSRQSAYTVHLDAFEGPLDLLLHLIRRSEIDIYNIPIAEISRQYLDYLRVLEDLNLEIAGEFLVMAATLVQIKSRMLLPQQMSEVPEEDGDVDPRAELVRRLLAYQQYKDAAETLSQRVILGRDTYARTDPTVELADVPAEEEAVDLELYELIAAFRAILSRLPNDRFHEVAAESISLSERLTEILVLLQEEESIVFDSLFPDGCGRAYLVVTFLALLELCRLKMARIQQTERYGTIWIRPAVVEERRDLSGADDGDY